LNLLATWFPNSRFVGIDLSEAAIEFACVEAEERGNKNASFIARDLSRFDQQAQPGTFDFITTFAPVHDQANPRNVLRGIRISLADDGVYLAQDIKASSAVQHNREHPLGPLLYTISCMHCMTVSLAEGGDGLGAMWGKEMAVQYFQEVGSKFLVG
jgi:2-polyprenyl-3-methyl-5-hydroxy-6-metoxy-1,4-benzoquinol methylase